MRNQPPEFANVVLDSLTAHIAVLDAKGVIIGVNEPWRRFAENNGGRRSDSYVGKNYLDVCEEALRSGEESLRPLLGGLRSVLAGTSDQFALEYPCHSPDQQRWFMARITPCRQYGESRAVVAHDDITARKQAEIALARAEDELRAAKATLEMANRELRESLLREQEISRTDALTGLCNRRHFFVLADKLFDVAERYGKPLSLVMLDVDHFKRINDRFGHQVGDRALEQIARCAQSHLRTSDVLARYGGEEMILLLPETGLDRALWVSEAIRNAVAALPLDTGRAPLPLTLSAGVADRLEHGDTLEALIRRADQALYAAKAAGRNRSLASESPRPRTSIDAAG